MKNGEIDNALARRLDEFGPNAGYVWSILQEYVENPSSVDPSWQEFFLELLKNVPSPLTGLSRPSGPSARSTERPSAAGKDRTLPGNGPEDAIQEAAAQEAAGPGRYSHAEIPAPPPEAASSLPSGEGHDAHEGAARRTPNPASHQATDGPLNRTPPALWGDSSGADTSSSRKRGSSGQPASGSPAGGTLPSLVMLRGAAARIVENMEASLALPTATSFHTVPAKVLEENRRLVNSNPTDHGKISYTHIVSWAIVQALKSFANLNASFVRVSGEPYRDAKQLINMGIAIDVSRRDGSRMLLVPNIKDAGSMDFGAFVDAYNAVVRNAQAGTLTPRDFQGTSITLTNPGTVGTTASVPRLMPGQGSIIAMGAIGYETEKQGTAAETLASLAIGKVMQMTCTYDHRVIQGAESGAFLQRIHELLLGDESFYEILFADLGIPFEPWRWSRDKNPVVDANGGGEVSRNTRVAQLINAYRVRGHLVARTNPLVYRPQHHPELDPAYYNLTIWDLDRVFHAETIQGLEHATLRGILEMLRETYCSTLGVEYMFIQEPERKLWLQEKMEPLRNNGPVSTERKKLILRKLIAAETFEHFLHTKYVGHKRFSIEGGESFLPLLDRILDGVAEQEGTRVVIGMAHRGRLNVLANTVGKPLAQMFNEFEENLDPLATQGTGDVKYHLGARGIHFTPSGRKIIVEVAPNPSHLESVNPVVEGMVRAMQDRAGEEGSSGIVPVLVHGDAAFAGQGVVGETLNLSRLAGYRTGGTIHLVINNQIGFTTAPDDARSTPYSTDVAKMIQAPIFHVNGDDPEMGVRAAELALAYRRKFQRDVVIDMICYRKYGHNESDEPSYTQPLLYQAIKAHIPVRQLYAGSLVREGAIPEAEVITMEKHARQSYEQAFDEGKRKDMRFIPDIPLAVSEEDLRAESQRTSRAESMDTLLTIARGLSEVPEGFTVHPKLARFLQARRRFGEPDSRIDWSFAEALAFGSLLLEGIPVRLSGQDTARGTFSQRHAVLYDARTGSEYIPLQHLREGQARFQVFDSLLSEAAALGFEFGYSVADPLSIVLWEAQFGDFANNAQVIIDQYIAASRTRWQQPSDLVLLLPHGYEGQGAEHSSARLERFLQLSAEENLTVVNCTLPAQYFHLLRRHKGSGRPLVLMTPKSLLRHPGAVSTPGDLTEGSFLDVIDDPDAGDRGQVTRLLLCSGKIFYDLAAARREGRAPESGGKESAHLDVKVALIRIEQLYPFPLEAVLGTIGRYANAREIAWLQEEPKNMGAWVYMEQQLRECLGADRKIRYIGRAASASPATGSLRLHQENQQAIIKEALSS